MEDRKPDVWLGHISMTTSDLDASEAFMIAVGMRPLFHFEKRAILELRAGTHLIIEEVEGFSPGPADFDLMVDDLPATHARLTEAGLAPSPIKEGKVHDSFVLTDPSGTTITVNDSHNSEFPV